ncbi:hypothetical protein GCM10008170_12350 [Methylopila capsulata]|uniref:Uncharacterized protein n=1 Tax=Methylopila capsulata TaxID=61654 RepID=A0A9W6IRL3_9HYPH|nr:hypothetical protein GCM10008170_12350 [Methylopila capsulata]
MSLTRLRSSGRPLWVGEGGDAPACGGRDGRLPVVVGDLGLSSNARHYLRRLWRMKALYAARRKALRRWVGSDVVLGMGGLAVMLGVANLRETEVRADWDRLARAIEAAARAAADPPPARPEPTSSRHG